VFFFLIRRFVERRQARKAERVQSLESHA